MLVNILSIFTKMFKVYKFVCLLFLLSSLFAQFGDIEVSLDSQQLKEIGRTITAEIPEQLKLFFTTTPWDEQYSDLEIPLTIQIIFEGTSEKGGERLYSVQCSFSNRLDQRYFARGIQFPYSMGQGIVYSPVIFEPLSSTMEYYGIIILAAEADTYEQFGGTRFYEHARDLAFEGERSQYPRGWSDRIELVDQLSKNRGLRLARFYFYDLDAYLQEGDHTAADESLAKMIENLELVFDTFPREYYTMIFINGHAHEFCELPAHLKNRESLLQLLIEMDPGNKETYQQGLEIKSE